MLLSKLVFLSVKNVIYLDDPNFVYDAFLDMQEDGYASDPDYNTHINNVFSPLNEAIARLSDLERIPYKVERVELECGTKEIDLNNLLQTDDPTNQKAANVKEMFAVGQMIGGKIERLRFKQIGNRVVVLDGVNLRYPLYIEYKEDIPQFDYGSYHYDFVEENNIRAINEATKVDIDMKDYGISDSMCNYIIEYVQGKLSETIEPSLANMHITRAESYFNNIRTVRPVFVQTIIKNVYSIED